MPVTILGRLAGTLGRVEKWRVIAEKVIDRIRADATNPGGDYAPGKSPVSVRGLMASEGCANTTAVKVLDYLVTEGWLLKVPDVGHFVAAAGVGGMPATVQEHGRRLDGHDHQLAEIRRHLGLDPA